MGMLSKLFNSNGGLLSKPGDKLLAEVTKSGRNVMKINSGGKKTSFVKYPTGTVVKTEVFRKK